MKCPKCQFENREEIKFCEECGAKMELICPVCKEIIQNTAKRLSDRELQEGFFNAEPIRGILSKAAN